MSVARSATLVAAGLATASVPLHGWMLAVHSHGVVLSLLMGVMALWCLWCAVGAVRGTASTRVRAVKHLWVMAAAMAVLHVALLTGLPGGAHQHGSDPARMAAGIGTGAGLMLAIVALEVAVCFACALALCPPSPRGWERGRPPVAEPGPDGHGHQPSL